MRCRHAAQVVQRRSGCLGVYHPCTSPLRWDTGYLFFFFQACAVPTDAVCPREMMRSTSSFLFRLASKGTRLGYRYFVKMLYLRDGQTVNLFARNPAQG